MAFKPPTVLEVLKDFQRPDGSVYRLQVVRFSEGPRAAIYLEVRQYHALEDSRGMPFLDEQGRGLGFTKGMTSQVLDWVLRHRDEVRAAMFTALEGVGRDRIDGLGFPR